MHCSKHFFDTDGTADGNTDDNADDNADGNANGNTDGNADATTDGISGGNADGNALEYNNFKVEYHIDDLPFTTYFAIIRSFLHTGD